MTNFNEEQLKKFREKYPQTDREDISGLFYGCMECGGNEIREDLEDFLRSSLQEQKENIIKSIQGQPCREEHCILKKRIIDKILETY